MPHNPSPRPVAEGLATLWAGLYPCPLAPGCPDVHFKPAAGLLPRGVYAPQDLSAVRLVVLLHAPSKPQPTELEAFQEARPGREQLAVAAGWTWDSYARALLPKEARKRGPDHRPKDLHPRLMRVLIEAMTETECPTPEQVLEHVVLSNLIKCQLTGERVHPRTFENCTSTYLVPELVTLGRVPILAVGTPARNALDKLVAAGQLPASQRYGWMHHPSIGFGRTQHTEAVATVRELLSST